MEIMVFQNDTALLNSKSSKKVHGQNFHSFVYKDYFSGNDLIGSTILCLNPKMKF